MEYVVRVGGSMVRQSKSFLAMRRGWPRGDMRNRPWKDSDVEFLEEGTSMKGTQE